MKQCQMSKLKVQKTSKPQSGKRAGFGLLTEKKNILAFVI